MVKFENLEFELEKLQLKESDLVVVKMTVNDYKISDQVSALKTIMGQCEKCRESLGINNQFIVLSPDQVDISKLFDSELKYGLTWINDDCKIIMGD